METTTMEDLGNESMTGGIGGDCVLGYIPGIVSLETMAKLDSFSVKYSVFHGYISAVICAFGIMANIANIIVLTRKNMISPTNLILLWLAVADLFTMLSYFPFSLCFYVFRDDQLRMFHTRSAGVIYFLMFHASFSIVCHTVAIWLTIALAIFRYIYICRPTKGAIYCNKRRAKLTILAVYILTMILCVPNYATNRIEYKIRTTNSSEIINSTVRYNYINETIYNPTVVTGEAADIIKQTNSLIQAVLFKLLPCAMLTTLTILLIHAMHKAYRKRMRLKSQGRKAESDKHGEHNRTTGMLLAVVVLFTLTELPQGILTLMNIFIQCFQWYVYDKLGDLIDTMALMNNSINFVLYCSMSKQFRDTFTEIFCKCFMKHQSGFFKMKPVKSELNGHVHRDSNCNNSHV